MVAGIVIVAALLLAMSFGRSLLDELVHPLPQKRFVALMPWPIEADGLNLPVVHRTIDVIGSRLARAEATTRDLMIISPGDVAGQPSLKAPTDVVRTLGANLVLATSIAHEASGLWLTLSVLDAATAKELRQRSQFIPEAELARIEDLATVAAAEILDVRLQKLRWDDQEELALVPPGVFQRFAAADDLASQPNDTGLDQAVEEYLKVVDAKPNFALAYARLSLAYARKYATSKDRAVLNLADRNAVLALRLNKDSMNGLLSRAMVDLYFGNTDIALDGLQRALDLDPNNPQILLARARAFRTLNRGADEIAVYREIIRNRPNFWPAYDQLGLNLYRQANYQQAADAFKEGLAIAPRIVRLLNNLGAMQMLLKRRTEAADTYRRSTAVAPTATAYQNLGTLSFMERDYRNALDSYKKSSDLNAKDDVVWRNIADTYAMLGDVSHVNENYGKAASLVSESLKINPKRAELWMTLAMYEAKLRHRSAAEDALYHAKELGASGMPSQFRKVQALALLGRREEALNILLDCVRNGQSLEDVELAIDLGDLRRDPRYLQTVAAVRAAAEQR
jgi:tetratricopeptide (TPR) repeat protein